MLTAAIPHFFAQLELQRLICEPYANNPGPNRIFDKLGFRFEKCYETVPAGWNFRLQVNRWSLSRTRLKRWH